MKSLILAMLMTLLSMIFWLSSSHKPFERGEYLKKEVLDSAVPINVTIDVEYLNRFKPAYEQ